MLEKADIVGWDVVMIDDHGDSRELISHVLSFAGVEVHTAENGQQGLEMITNLNPALVLIDISMPVMDGWTVIKHVRDDETISDTPMIAITAHALVGDRERVLEAGFDHYISKPINLPSFIDDLLKAINTLPRVQAYLDQWEKAS
ncbi:MAG: response regulator [Chloroflexi bacterium]|nr:response regulator [Chloroflexota bacterium]